MPVARDGDRVLEPARDAVRADEIPAGATRDHSEVDAAAAGQALHDLVDRPVASHGDDQRGAFVSRPRREVAELARPLGEQGVSAEAERRSAVSELGPATSDRPTLGGRVDEKDGLANGQR